MRRERASECILNLPARRVLDCNLLTRMHEFTGLRQRASSLGVLEKLAPHHVQQQLPGVFIWQPVFLKRTAQC